MEDSSPMRELLELIDEVLAERRWSARQASIEATGAPNLVMNMRRGKVPSFERLRALCDVRGLEFYVGRARTVRGAEFDVARLTLALEALEEGFSDADRRLSVHDRAQLLVAVYALLGEGDAEAGTARVRELIAISRRFGVAEAVPE